MGKRRVKSRWLYLIRWLDAESDPAWGRGAAVPPSVINVGFIIDRPNKSQVERVYRIAGSWSEEEPGSVMTIPAGMVREVTKLQRVEIKWR